MGFMGVSFIKYEKDSCSFILWIFVDLTTTQLMLWLMGSLSTLVYGIQQVLLFLNFVTCVS